MLARLAAWPWFLARVLPEAQCQGWPEGAKYWLRVLTEIKNRGVRDACMLVCDGLKGLPDAVSAVWEKTIAQTCIVHLLRNSFKYASKRDWAQIAKNLKPVYTATSEPEALDRLAEFSGKWEKRYPAIIRPRENAWAEKSNRYLDRPSPLPSLLFLLARYQRGPGAGEPLLLPDRSVYSH